MVKKKNVNLTKITFLVVILIAALTGAFLINHFFVSKKPIDIPKVAVATPETKTEIQKTEKYNVPILMYHYIRVADPADTLGVALSVTPTNFDAQMKWLKNNNYESMKLVDLADPQKKTLSKIIASKKKPIVITFDDGYDNAYTQALPILKKYGFFGTFFIIRDFVGRPEYATQVQIDEMAAQGMEIGSHTLDHMDLAKSSLEVDHKQIFGSKMGADVFCYPSGRFTEETVGLVKEAGYKVAVTTKPGIANQDSNIFELPRVRITDIDSELFARRVQGLK